MISSSIVRSSVLLEQPGCLVDPMKTLENVNNESYVAEAIDFMRAMNEEYTNQTKVLYRGLLEAKNTYAIQESFSDFFSWVKKIIDKAIAFIKKLYDKFINFIMKLFKSDSYLKKNKNKISDFTGEFDIEGYKFTIDSSVPNLDLLTSIDSEFDLKGKTSQELQAQYTKKKENMEDLLNSKRASILNNKAGSSIDEYDFHDECFKVYRNGESDSDKITINSTAALDAYHRFENCEKLVKDAKKECKDIVKSYNDLAKAYDKMVGKLTGESYENVHLVDAKTGNIGDKTTVDKDTGLQLDLYAKLNSSFCNKIISMYNLAFTMKLDAIKAQFNQDKAICYRAISKANSSK